MTATPPPAGRRPSWRARWAERENDRRRRAQAGDAEAWRRRADELTRLRVEVTGLIGTSPPPAAAPVKLRHGEVVHRVLRAAELLTVEVRQASDLPAPGLAVDPAGTDAPGRPLPRGIAAVDGGAVVVTNRRVAFLGQQHQRIWWYADLAGPAHHPRAPLTLLPTTDGSPLAGLLVPPPAALTFRFHLTLAFADGLGNRDAVAACLDDLVAAHQRGRPLASPAAAPAQAPVLARLHDRRLAGAAAALAASLAVAGAVRAGPALAPIPFAPAGKPSVVITDVTVPAGASPTAEDVPRATSPPPGTVPATPSAAAIGGVTGYPGLPTPVGTAPPGEPTPGGIAPSGGPAPDGTGLLEGPAPIGTPPVVLPDAPGTLPVPQPTVSAPLPGRSAHSGSTTGVHASLRPGSSTGAFRQAA